MDDRAAAVRKTRRRKLDALVANYGSQANLARKVECQPNEINRALKDDRRSITDDFARKIESKCGLEIGWLDRDDAVQAIPLTLEWPFPVELLHRFNKLPTARRTKIGKALDAIVGLAENDESHATVKKKRK